MNYVSIFLEHVYFFNGLDRLNIEFLERGLEFFVVGAGGLVDFFHLSAGSTFTADVD